MRHLTDCVSITWLSIGIQKTALPISHAITCMARTYNLVLFSWHWIFLKDTDVHSYVHTHAHTHTHTHTHEYTHTHTHRNTYKLPKMGSGFLWLKNQYSRHRLVERAVCFISEVGNQRRKWTYVQLPTPHSGCMCMCV